MGLGDIWSLDTWQDKALMADAVSQWWTNLLILKITQHSHLVRKCTDTIVSVKKSEWSKVGKRKGCENPLDFRWVLRMPTTYS